MVSISGFFFLVPNDNLMLFILVKKLIFSVFWVGSFFFLLKESFIFVNRPIFSFFTRGSDVFFLKFRLIFGNLMFFIFVKRLIFSLFSLGFGEVLCVVWKLCLILLPALWNFAFILVSKLGVFSFEGDMTTRHYCSEAERY